VRFRKKTNLQLHYFFQLLEIAASNENSYIVDVFRTEPLNRT